MTTQRHRFLNAVGLLAIAAAPVSAQQDVDNVAAFARMYGAVRWFYPSDAAAALDWNRFAVHGVSKVRSARNAAELEETLEELFTVLGPGIEIGKTLPQKRAPGPRDRDLVAWHYRGVGISEGMGNVYQAKRVNRAGPPSLRSASSNRGQLIDAASIRGKTLRMRGRARVADPNAPGWAGFWVRVDREPQSFGFFDNMSDRPVRDTAWREYVIEGPIASDAKRVVVGILSVGAMTLDADGIELAVRDSAGAWTPLPLHDASFEVAADSNRAWGGGGPHVVTRPSSGAAHGARFIRMAPAPATVGGSVPPADALETPFAGSSVDVDLGRELQARIPFALADAEARTEPQGLGELRSALALLGNTSGRDDIDVRLADAVVAWNVFRHFYPYWGDIRVDWDARLRPQLEIAFAATTREAHHDALRALVADIQDGHGGVNDVTRRASWRQPFTFRVIGEQLVVTGSRDSTVPVGSIVTSIDDESAAARVAKEARLSSGTRQWRESRAASALLACKQSDVLLKLELPNGRTRESRIACIQGFGAARESRPDSIAELQPGIWYVDLTRVRAAQLRPALETLSRARGMVFDVRGYPTDAGAALLPHVMSAREDTSDRWMHVPRIAAPFGGIVDWHSVSWNVQPAIPYISGQKIWLTDGRAISYAESVMGHVADHKLGTIIGAPTAGANGNVASFSVPGGFSIMFTGMRVTRHDGRTQFHMLGVPPDVPLEPTLAGIRAGRDELLERALSILRLQP